jgi:hypothetical protein
MNRSGLLRCSSVLLVVVVMCGSLFAEFPPPATADIPFDFYISGVKLPAGQYTLSIIAPTYVLLRSKDGKVEQDLYFMQSASPGKNPPFKIVFAQRDGKYYFSEVWSILGTSQLTSFNPQPGDKTKDVPLKPVEKGVVKSPPGLQ